MSSNLMTIIAYRHGHAEGQDDRSIDAQKGDINSALDSLGIQQKNALAGFTPNFLQSVGMTSMPLVVIGNRLRVIDTSSAVMYALEESNLFEGEAIYLPESRVNEKYFGLTNLLQNLEKPTWIEKKTADFLNKITIKLYDPDPHRFVHLGGEGHVGLYNRVEAGLLKSIAYAQSIENSYVMIPTSGGVMQCIQQMLGNSSSHGINNPNNCDVHTYVGEIDSFGRPVGQWSMHKVYDGELMMPVYEELKAKPLVIQDPSHQEQKSIQKNIVSFQVPDDLRGQFTPILCEHFKHKLDDVGRANDKILLSRDFDFFGGTGRQFEMLYTEVQRQCREKQLKLAL